MYGGNSKILCRRYRFTNGLLKENHLFIFAIFFTDSISRFTLQKSLYNIKKAFVRLNSFDQLNVRNPIVENMIHNAVYAR